MESAEGAAGAPLGPIGSSMVLGDPSPSHILSMNTLLRTESKRVMNEYKTTYPNAVVQAPPTLRAYTTLPVQKGVFMGDTKRSKVWKSRSTAQTITADPLEYMEYENSTLGGMRKEASKTKLPPINLVKSRSASPTKKTKTKGLSDGEKFSLWCYHNRNRIHDTMSGFDMSSEGFMTAPRVLAVLDQELNADETMSIDLAAAQEIVLAAPFQDFTTSSGKNLTGVMDYGQFLQAQWLAGMKLYNKINTISPVKTVFNKPMPAELMSDGRVFNSMAEAREAQRLTDAVMSGRRKARDDMEYDAAVELLKQCNFEKIKSPSGRDKITATLSAYSVGSGMGRAMRKAKKNIPPPSKGEQDEGCTLM